MDITEDTIKGALILYKFFMIVALPIIIAGIIELLFIKQEDPNEKQH